jgi:hypothetical protein
MSTQRRENRWQRTSCTEGKVSTRRFLPDGVQRVGDPGHSNPAPITRIRRADASGGTAPPVTPAWLATNSLQLDRRIVKLVRQDIRRGSPPPGVARRTASRTSAIHGSSLPHIPFPPGLALIHSTLPQVPAGRRRWAERYDGKRDLYLQHAA